MLFDTRRMRDTPLDVRSEMKWLTIGDTIPVKTIHVSYVKFLYQQNYKEVWRGGGGGGD